MSADHADRARCVGDRLDHLKLSRDEIRVGRPWLTGEHVERFGEQPIAGKDRHPLTGDDVQRRTSSPHRVIVHGGEIVVDQRIGMNQFDGACGRHRERAVAADCIGAGQTKNRPQTLAAGHEAVLHCLQHDSRAVRSGREDRREYGFDLSEARVEVAGELAGCQTFDSSSEVSVAGAGLSWPRSFRISMRRSASSRRAWQ